MKKIIIFFLICTISFAQKKSIEQRIDSVLALMTLDEKVAFLSSNPGVERLGIKKMGHVEGLHGLAQGAPGGWGRRGPVTTTTFPQSYGMGETWDTEVMRQAGAVEGYEVRYISQSEKYGRRGGLIIPRARNRAAARGRRGGAIIATEARIRFRLRSGLRPSASGSRGSFREYAAARRASPAQGRA